MASIEIIRQKLTPWTPRNGSARYYVNDWKAIINLNVEYYGTGNVKSVDYDGHPQSNTFYNKKIAGTKVWFDEDAQVHVDYCGDDATAEDIKTKVDLAYSEVSWSCDGCVHKTDSYKTGVASHCGRAFSAEEQLIIIDEYHPCPFRDEVA